MSEIMANDERGMCDSDPGRQGRRPAVAALWLCAAMAMLFTAACERSEPQVSTVESPAAAAGPDAAAPPVSATPAPAVPEANPEADPLTGMRHVAGVNCSRSESGIHTCTAPGYDISGADRACAEDDTGFGAVLDDAGATLLDRFPGSGANPIAKLPKGQFLCVQFVADATAGGEGWAYVTAIPTASVKRCEGNPSCGDVPFAPQWSDEAPQGTCEVGEEGRYTIACPAGWAPRSAIEEYSMGLGGG